MAAAAAEAGGPGAGAGGAGGDSDAATAADSEAQRGRAARAGPLRLSVPSPVRRQSSVSGESLALFNLRPKLAAQQPNLIKITRTLGPDFYAQ